MKIRTILKNIYHLCENYLFLIRYPILKDSLRINSHLTAKERVALYDLAIPCTTIIEIGSYIGASTCCFGAALKNSAKGKVYCVDTWNNDAMSEGSRETWQEFQVNTKKYQNNIIPIRGYSTAVVDEIDSQIKSIDLLFIDGDHSYDGVKADWESYKKLLRPGSVVIFHDWGWAEGVKRVIDEDVKAIVSSYAHLPNLWWGTIRGES